MELWSLMHFLMPHVFESHKDFKEWFSSPLTSMVEGSAEYNNDLIHRLHKVLRPFLLRRLKSEVEKQMPKKYQHEVKCPLSKRQRFLYDDFMSRAKVTLKFVKFIYSEKVTKFCEIFTLLLSYVVPVKSKLKISQNFVAFSEYMNFKRMSYKEFKKFFTFADIPHRF